MITPNTLPLPSSAYTEVVAGNSGRRAFPRSRTYDLSRAERMASPHTPTRVLLVAALLGSTFRNYWTYSHYEHLDPSVWMSFVNGTGVAPEQYRIGVKLVAWWLMRHVGGGFRHSFALLDIVGSVVAGLLLYALLERSPAYRQARSSQQWMASAAFLTLFFYYLSWLPWFEKAETLPSAGLVAGLLWMWSPHFGRVEARFRQASRAASVCGLLLLTLAQALVRADVALALSLGMLVAALSRRFAHGLSLPRAPAAWTAGSCAVLAAGTQVYMMRVAYPHATYGDTPVFMLRYDFADPLVAGPFVLFLLPYAWTALAAWRSIRSSKAERSDGQDTASLGMLLGSLLYIPLWMVLGKLDEVRIFLPFALALVPLSTEFLLRRMDAPELEAGRPEALSGCDAI